MAKKQKMAVEGMLTVAGTPATNAPEKVISKDNEARERKWRAEDALRDIERAEKHKSDKALMKDVKLCAKEKMKAYGKL